MYHLGRSLTCRKIHLEDLENGGKKKSKKMFRILFAQFGRQNHETKVRIQVQKYPLQIGRLLFLCEKMLCPSSIWRRDSNPRPSEHESPPITTTPGNVMPELTSATCTDGVVKISKPVANVISKLCYAVIG